MKKKIALREEIVKYIFPTSNPKIIQGEDGCIACDFMKVYPPKLGIFIPNEIDHSNYSSAFPKSFEEYFIDLYEETEYLSRLLEVPIVPNLRNVGVECIPGTIIQPEDGEYAVFRFDELVDPRKKTELLCRVQLDRLSIDDKIDILSVDPKFRAEVMGLNNTQYLYWTMSLSRLFRINDEVLAAIFAFANSLRFTNGPF